MIHVSWFNAEHSAILWRFDARFSTEDAYLALYCTRVLIRKTNTPFDIVADMRKTMTIPSRVIELLRTAHAIAPETYHSTIFVEPSPFIKALLGVAHTSRNMRGRFVFVATLDQAARLVAARRVDDPLEAATQPV
ncbi:MAG: hypothetical protein OHK0046_14050 [Anaerolineae bacterium]